MAYIDWLWMPKAPSDAEISSQMIGIYGISPTAYWINQAQGRYSGRRFLSKQNERRMKITLYKDPYVADKYNIAWAVERLNGETSYSTNLWFCYFSEGGIAQDYYEYLLNFRVYDANTLVSSARVTGDAYFNDPNIPVYDTEALADAAMADEIWKEKTKYDGGGYSHTGGGGETWGGGGLFDHSSDPIDFTALPVDYGTATKLFRIYTPTAQQLSDFGDYLFSSAFDPDTLKKLFANPMDYIMGLSVVPFTVDPTSLNAHDIYIGNIDTGVQSHYCNKQFISFDCGSLLVKPFWDAYLDYAPYTRISIFLPFIGYRELDDDIMGNTVQVKYIIDIITGACMAEVKIGDALRYSFVGQCAANIPLSATDWTNSIQGALQIAGEIGGMATTGAVSAAGVSNVASTAINMVKPAVQRSGGFSGSGAFLGCKTPHLVIERPKQALPENAANIMGFPSYIYTSLGTCEEFTQVDEWTPEGFNCSREELEEIDRLLKEGVYL